MRNLLKILFGEKQLDKPNVAAVSNPGYDNKMEDPFERAIAAEGVVVGSLAGGRSVGYANAEASTSANPDEVLETVEKPLIAYQIWRYENLRRKRNQPSRTAILNLSGRVIYEESADDITTTKPQYSKSCERPATARAMSMEKFAEFCAAMPPGIGEEEYCARVIERLEKGGDVA